MFESGGKVKVKKRTMFPMIARNLYELYSKHSSIDDLSTQDKKKLKQEFLNKVWKVFGTQFRDYWARTDLNILNKIEKNEKVKMVDLSMVFRSVVEMAIEGFR